jgi:GH15 family glucan-1,4-alpha-glucosidase
MGYRPIESYGLIGDMHTAALVGADGAIDWLCLPHFDSPSVFAAILDDTKGGRFQIAPTSAEATCRQLYWPDTNVLVTRFLDHHGAAELIDFMPVGVDRSQHGEGHGHRIVRRVTVQRGSVTLRLHCQPAFDYARARHELRVDGGLARFTYPGGACALYSPIDLEGNDRGGVDATFELVAGQSATFVFGDIDDADDGSHLRIGEADGDRLLRSTIQYWRRWIAQCTYEGRWLEVVHRSALALKLLTFEPTGAIVAAPTTSLPERLGGGRNWDYRYTWIRDAAFTVYAFIRLGFTAEAEAFMGYLSRLCTDDHGPDGYLQIMYGIDGRRELTEEELPHLEGYRCSRPVRIGNHAHGQLQLDIYGELMDAAYLVNKYGAPLGYDTWRTLRKYVDWVVDNWEREDDGIWEVRNGSQHFVYSKLMCWVAVDRGIRLAEKRSFPCDRSRWRRARDAIYEAIQKRGYDEKRQAFVQAFGSDALDASVLMMPLTFFMAPTDPRMLSTIRAIMARPDQGGLVSDSLVYRYDVRLTPDGIEGDEGTFNICTYWLVEALTRAGRYEHHYLEQGRTIFERMLAYANPLGLFAEETGSRGEALGNYPQAFTHLGLISAAFNLNRTLG